MATIDTPVPDEKTSNDALIRLLEEFEYYPISDEREFSRHLKGWRGCVAGGAAVAVGVSGMGIAVSNIAWSSLFFYIVGAALVVLGIFTVVSSFSRETFARLNKWLERVIWLAAIGIHIIMMLPLLVPVGVSIYSAWRMNDPSVDTGSWTDELLPIFLINIITALVTLAVRTGSIRLGVNVLRTRLRTGIWSLWGDSIAVASVFSIPVVLLTVLDTVVGWAPVAITLGAALIGFHVRQARRFDQNVKYLLDSLDTIRIKALLADGETSDPELYEAIRQLQRDMSQSPRTMGTPFTFRGLVAVCVIADARLVKRGAEKLTFRGTRRLQIAKEVYNLNESRFVEQVGWTFDALVQQVDTALTPNLESVRRDDVRTIYERSMHDS